MIEQLVRDAVSNGARRGVVCDHLGVSVRTLERWQRRPEDGRAGPHRRPKNELSAAERRRVLEIATSTEFRDLAPSQIVPRLADRGLYVASEATFYRILREEKLLAHRGRAKAPAHHAPDPHLATAPNQVWTWDITYLKTSIRGRFFYLYMIVDIFSRRIVGWAVHQQESPDQASKLIGRACQEADIHSDGLVLHSDNGGPMKGSTMLATLQRLGVVASFSRPSVSDDNPFSEALFRTLKYRPEFPRRPFETIAQARAWVEGFVGWYNAEHRHSGIRFVTPDQRHAGIDSAVLEARRVVYERARRRHPERWSGAIRDWSPVREVYLNPERAHAKAAA